MTYWVDVPSLAQRTADCRYCTAVLTDIASQESKNQKVRNTYGITTRLGADFPADRVKAAVVTLCNLNYITVSFSSTSDSLKAPTMTDAGWAMSGVDKPFWMFP
jgi:hypothetical protein